MRKGLIAVIIISLLIIIAGCISIYYDKGQKVSPPESMQAENTEKPKTIDKGDEEKTTVLLYFSKKQTGQLTAEKREVLRTKILKKPEETILNELLKGPAISDLMPAIPKGTKLISVKKEGSLVTVNFSIEFVDNHPGGSAGETITIYSIVNSLTELKDVEKVKFLIEGKEREEYKGHYKFNIPFERNENYLSLAHLSSLFITSS